MRDVPYGTGNHMCLRSRAFLGQIWIISKRSAMREGAVQEMEFRGFSLMNGSGFTVVDLGADVRTHRFVEAVKNNGSTQIRIIKRGQRSVSFNS